MRMPILHYSKVSAGGNIFFIGRFHKKKTLKLKRNIGAYIPAITLIIMVKKEQMLQCHTVVLRGAGMMKYKNIDIISLFILYHLWKATVVYFNLV